MAGSRSGVTLSRVILRVLGIGVWWCLLLGCVGRDEDEAEYTGGK